MYLTKELLEKKKVNIYCPTIYEEVSKKPQELMDILDKIQKKKLDSNELLTLPYFIPFDLEEEKKMEEILNLINCKAVIYSKNIKNSEVVSESSEVKDSDCIWKSNNVTNSSYVTDSNVISNSQHIKDSRYVIDSYEVTESADVDNSCAVYRSNHVLNSFLVSLGIDISDSIGIIASDEIKNCYFCKGCSDMVNGIFCYSFDWTDKDKYWFCNEEISKEKFEGYVKMIKRIIEGSYLGHKDRLSDYEIGNLRDWANSLPKADKDYITVILYSIAKVGNNSYDNE